MTIIVRPNAESVTSINILHSSVFDDATITVSSEADGFEGVNVISDETWSNWRPVNGTSSIVADCGSAVECDALGIAAHDLASTVVSVVLAYSSDDVTYTNVFAPYLPLTNDDILILFPAISARYWRFRLVSSGGDRANVGVVKLGKKLAFPSGVVSGHVPLHHAKKIEMLSNESMGGHLLRNRVEKRGAMTSVDAGLVDRDFAETDLLPFEANYNNGRAFFYCGDPTNTPKDFGYCWRPNGSDTMGVTWEEGIHMASVRFEVKAYVRS